MSTSSKLTRLGSAGVKTKVKWFGNKVHRDIKLGMRQRVMLAAQLLRDRTVRNISKPVVWGKAARQGRDDRGRFIAKKRVVVERSKPGEFPRAETTRLMKDIYWEMTGEHEAVVGTTLDYGAILELSQRLDRSFLRRTLREQQPMIRKVLLSGPKLPGQTHSVGIEFF